MSNKITDNFYYYEFAPKGSLKSWKPVNKYQKYLIDMLATNLQVLRTDFPKGSFMKVTSGVRTEQDLVRLESQGYHPSKTSDHYFGFAPRIDRYSYKYDRFGPTYNFSSGAADIVPVGGLSTQDLFKMAIDYYKSGRVHFGQVIFEYNPRTGVSWVHFSNDYKSLFNSEIVTLLNKKRFLSSNNGGKSYEIVVV